MLRILLGDLRHKTLGRHSTYIPLGIGFIASYCKKYFGREVDIRLHDDPDRILGDIDSWKPHVLGLTNYMWNAEINNLIFENAKLCNSHIVCTAGGPEFPIEQGAQEEYLRGKPAIDFFCLMEGEKAFSNIIAKMLGGSDLRQLKTQDLHGMVFINPETGQTVRQQKIERITDLDDIPSPYLSALFDQYFTGEYSPSIQTSRGCPFSCRYCRASDSNYSKLASFDLERVRDEITYIAKKAHQSKTHGLLIMDSNFGVLERDVQIAEHIRQMQDRYGWPQSIIADTTKNNYERVFKMVKILQNRMQPLCSLQTTNEATLKLIRRENLPFDQYEKVQQKLVACGIKPATELIVPMPLETKTSFLETLQRVYSSGIENITVFTWMMLPGTELASEVYRKKYKLETGYRIVPRQFGSYKGKKCFEIEEICCGTSTMSTEEYLECRGFAFLGFLLGRSQYDLIRKIISFFAVDSYQFLLRIYEKITSDRSMFSILFQNLLQETRDEVFESRAAIYEYYSKQVNYDRLLKGETGDNIFRKYLAKTMLDVFSDSLDLIFESTADLLSERGLLSECNQEFLASAKKWMLLSMDFAQLFKNIQCADETVSEEFLFDIRKWYDDVPKGSLEQYKYSIKVKFYYDVPFITNLIVQNMKLYGEDIYYCLGKMLISYSPDVFWKKHDIIERTSH